LGCKGEEAGAEQQCHAVHTEPAALQLTLCHTRRAPDIALADLHKAAANTQRCQRAGHHAAAGQAVERHGGAAHLCDLGDKGGVAGAQHMAHT
jgi:hypothetical protein